ncbi:MAG: tRNA (adenosine(37)-N6)-threonylcarbamoyltransferase complex transferase subunit TsaD [bacterium]
MIILAIETSCDDTCIAVLKFKKGAVKILSNIVSSQVKLHQKYGGVFPSLAKREHQRNLTPVLIKALKEAGFEISNFKFLISKQIPKNKFKIPKINAIAVTVGPGLEPCLWTGINFAVELAEKMNLPIIPINHIEAHIVANFIRENSKLQITNYKKLLPAVCLVVSGGHTQLILMKGFGKYIILGETRDDAAGECFDKTARILELGYPGGPAIAQQARQWQKALSKKPLLPRPMLNQKNYDFSFSGLKTAVLYDFKNRSPKIRKSKQYIQEMSAEIQQAIIDVLIYKTLKAAKNSKAKTIILGGGVGANQELRKQLKEKLEKEMPKAKYLVPDKKYCTDNAAMIAATAYYHLPEQTKEWKNIKANANLRIDGKI